MQRSDVWSSDKHLVTNPPQQENEILAIDAEWADYQGELISIALVPLSHSVLPFYRELAFTQRPSDWVKENVVSKLDGEPVRTEVVQAELELYLSQFNNVTVVADWPEDFAYFCRLLTTGPGKRIKLPELEMRFVPVNEMSVQSAVPHHALFDAMANRDHYLRSGI